MNRFIAIVSLFLVGGTLIPAAVAVQNAPTQKLEWKEYSYPEDGIVFSAPSKPAFMKQNQDTADGPVELHLHYIEMSGSVAFIGVGDMKEKKNDAPVKAILEGAKTSSLRARKATLVSEKQVSLQGNSGIEYEANGDTFHFRARIFFVKGKMVTALVNAPIASPLSSEAMKLFDTLRFVEPLPAKN